MFNYNNAFTFMVEVLYLSPVTKGFTPQDANVTDYKHFTGSAQ